MRTRLTDRTIAAMRSKTERLDVGDSIARGLRLRVSPDGSKTFSVLCRAGGKLSRFTIGPHPEISLAVARERAREIVAEARLGRNPQAEKVAARRASREAIPFRVLAERFIEARDPNLSDTTATEYRRMVKKHLAGDVGDDVGGIPIRDLTRADLRELLEGIAKVAPVMSNRVYQFVRAACRWGVRRDFLTSDPSVGLERPRREKSRERVLSDAEIKKLLEALPVNRPVVAAYVRTLLLLGQRSGETAAMRWRDLDLEAKQPTWTVPGQFRKGGRVHVVPLSPGAVHVIESLKPLTGSTERVFTGLPTSNAQRDWWRAIHAAAVAAGAAPFTKHDLRRTCATGCAKLGAQPHVVSRILGHQHAEGTLAVTSIYSRHSYLPETAAALTAWGAHVDAIERGERRPAAVLPMGRRR